MDINYYSMENPENNKIQISDHKIKKVICNKGKAIDAGSGLSNISCANIYRNI